MNLSAAACGLLAATTLSLSSGCIAAVDTDGAAVETTAEGLTIANGWDFSLPQSHPEYFSGFWAGDGSRGGEIHHQGITTSWAELNPQNGVYDWAKIQSALAAASAGAYLVIFRLMNLNIYQDGKFGAHGTMVPQWVIDACKAAGNPIRKLELRAPEFPGETIQAAAPWNTCLKSKYKSFIEAFEAKGFAANSHFAGMYITGLSTSFGEEMVVSSNAVIDPMKTGADPITHAKMQTAFMDRIDWWVAAFGKYRYKLAWVGSENWGEFGPDGDAIDNHALQAGVGRRQGWLETGFNKDIDDPNYASLSLDARSDYRTDESNPWLQDKLPYYFGEEIESWNAGIHPNESYSFRVATLRALQMRMRYLWSNQPGVALDPSVAHYFNEVAGKSATNAPDAWVYLRETRVRVSGCIKARNFDRWLRQDETAATGSVTRRGSKVIRRPLPYDCTTEGESTINRDWEGRLTDKVNGNPRMRLIVDRAFLPQGTHHDMLLKVTYRDAGNSFTVSYCSAGAPATTGVIHASGSAAGAPWRTATIALSSVGADRCLDGAHDLGLNATSGDLEAAFVRIIKN